MRYLRQRILRTLGGGPQTLEEIGLDIIAYPNDVIAEQLDALMCDGVVEYCEKDKVYIIYAPMENRAMKEKP